MVIDIKNTVSENEGRAKHLVIDINKKKVDFPKKAAHISKSDSSEAVLAKNELKSPLFSEFAVKITPKTLRELVFDASKHQSDKDAMRKMLSEAGNNSINIAFPMLVDEKNPNESNLDYVPHGKPSEKVLIKLFDLFDVEGFDSIILPVPQNAYFFEWAKTATEVFKTRKSDYLNEFMLTGFIPRNITDNKAVSLANFYNESDINSLAFDFAAQKVPEGRMRSIIDQLGDKWSKMHIHGTNIPHYNWHGTWKKQVVPIYDVLVSIYGFDSFGNLRMGRGSPAVPSNKIRDKIERKRYRLIDTYGTYNYEGLSNLSENFDVKCKCPICRNTNPLNLYDKSTSNDSIKTLSNELKTHRLYSTHKEMNEINKLIDNNKYFDHLLEKKDATNDINSLLKSVS